MERQLAEEPKLARLAPAAGPMGERRVQEAATARVLEPALDPPLPNRQDKAARALAHQRGGLWAHAGALASLRRAAVFDTSDEP